MYLNVSFCNYLVVPITLPSTFISRLSLALFMERGIGDKNILRRFCNEFCAVVERHARYVIVAGFLAIATGRTRSTEDIDMITEGVPEPIFVRIHQELVSHGFVCMQSDDPRVIYDDYLTKKAGVRYTWEDRPVPEMEVKFAKDSLDEIALRSRIKIPLTGVAVWFAPADMNIAFKEEYLKSDKDLEDAKHLRLVFSQEINEEKIKYYKNLINETRK